MNQELEKVKNIDRSILLKPKTRESRENNPYEWTMVTTFSSQYWWINKIMKKHWQILKSDSILGPILPEKPNVIFRRNTAPKDNPPEPAVCTFGNLKGFFPCVKCVEPLKPCEHLPFLQGLPPKRYEIDDFITCSTIGVI